MYIYAPLSKDINDLLNCASFLKVQTEGRVSHIRKKCFPHNSTHTHIHFCTYGSIDSGFIHIDFMVTLGTFSEVILGLLLFSQPSIA